MKKSKPIKVNSLEDLGRALRTREARNNPGKAIITKIVQGGREGGKTQAATLWLNEASEIDPEAYKQIAERLGIKPALFGVTSGPPKDNPWINHGSGTTWPADILKAIEDSPLLTDDYKRYLLGDWVPGPMLIEEKPDRVTIKQSAEFKPRRKK